MNKDLIICILYIIKFIVCFSVVILMIRHTNKDFSLPVSFVLSVSAYNTVWQLFDEIFDILNISLD